MKKLARRCSGILIGSLCVVEVSLAQAVDQDALVFSAGVQHQYDSNFFRSPEEIEEQITRAGAGVSFRKQFSAQRLALSARANQYRYAEQDDLNAAAVEGEASWLGQFTNNISTQVNWLREETPVDKLEFIGKDLVAKEDANAWLSLGDNKSIGWILGFHQLDMAHSNTERRALDFHDRDFFSELRYRASSASWFGLRYRAGERQHQFLNPTQGNLDFDYRQWELETAWEVTTKTKLTGLVGYFDRTAKADAMTANEGEGKLVSISMDWAVTEKLNTHLSYGFNQPAIGETADAPAEISKSSLLLQWQFTPKLQAGVGASYAEFDYAQGALVVERTERSVALTPLQLSWVYSDRLGVRFSSQWIDRSSPVIERDFQGYSAALGLAFQF